MKSVQFMNVRQYHSMQNKKKQASENWKPDSMWYFMREDDKGYPTTIRKRGYVAYDGSRACFGLSMAQCEANYQQASKYDN